MNNQQEDCLLIIANPFETRVIQSPTEIIETLINLIEAFKSCDDKRCDHREDILRLEKIKKGMIGSHAH